MRKGMTFEENVGEKRFNGISRTIVRVFFASLGKIQKKL